MQASPLYNQVSQVIDTINNSVSLIASGASVTIEAGRVEIRKNFDAKRGSRVKIDKFVD